MNKSESIKELATALTKFQAEIENPKNTADNPFFKSKYAPLQDILSLVRPLLSKHGLSVVQAPSGDGENIIVTTLLLHESGEWIEPEPLVLKADKATAQGAGSAITYARRYSLSAILGISSEDDDDGNHASRQSQKVPEQANGASKRTAQAQAGPTAQTITEAQAKRLFAIARGNQNIVKDTLKTFGYKNSTDIKKSEYSQICKLVEDTVKTQEITPPWEQ